VLFGRRQLELPGRYEKLKAFWEDKKGTLPPSGTGRTIRSSSSSDVLPADLKVRELTFRFFLMNKITEVYLFCLVFA